MPRKLRSNTFTTAFRQGNISNFIESFLNSKKAQDRAPETISYYRTSLALFIKYLQTNGIVAWQDLNPGVIYAYFNQLKADGHKQGGAHAYFRAIKAYCNWVWEMYEPELSNPISKVKCSNRKPEPIPGITLQDVKHLIKSADQGKFPERDKAIFYSFFYSS